MIRITTTTKITIDNQDHYPRAVRFLAIKKPPRFRGTVWCQRYLHQHAARRQGWLK